MQNQRAELEWRDGEVPVSQQFDDPYYSLENGLSETRHVFLQGNRLPERFVDGFHIAELGFGTGLNFLATVQAWEESGTRGQLRFTSFECFPLEAQDISRALACFPELEDLAADFVRYWADGRPGAFRNTIELTIVEGDARESLPEWSGIADAWYLDGFSPAKNPELWGDSLMQNVAAHTREGGTFATYTAAGSVRRALGDAGFEVARVPGYGRKRHMSIGHKQ